MYALHPFVCRPHSVMFEKLTIFGDIPVQTVMVLEPNGELVTALYHQAETA
jgi:hypothetical protein